MSHEFGFVVADGFTIDHASFDELSVSETDSLHKSDRPVSLKVSEIFGHYAEDGTFTPHENLEFRRHIFRSIIEEQYGTRKLTKFLKGD